LNEFLYDLRAELSLEVHDVVGKAELVGDPSGILKII